MDPRPIAALLALLAACGRIGYPEGEAAPGGADAGRDASLVDGAIVVRDGGGRDGSVSPGSDASVMRDDASTPPGDAGVPLGDAGTVTVGLSSFELGLATACAISPARDLHCWGDNADGALGSGSPAPPSVDRPQVVAAVPGVAGVTVGEAHGCAWTDAGEVWCWGLNVTGQLARGTATRSEPLPARTVDTAPYVNVSAGRFFTCGIHAGGALFCWGENTVGQLGVAGMELSALPVALSPGTRWLDVSAGGRHACAVREDGTLWCWGENVDGQLGGSGSDPAPREVAGGPFVQVAAGKHHVCGLRADGGLLCWGRNLEGELGQGDLAVHSGPVTVPGAWRDVAAGWFHTCAIDEASALHCWGSNEAGAIAPTVGSYTARPFSIAGGERFVDVDAGYAFSCAEHEDGTLRCWGNNSQGQLGVGDSGVHGTPTTIAPFP